MTPTTLSPAAVPPATAAEAPITETPAAEPRLTDRLQQLLDASHRLITQGQVVDGFRLLVHPLSALWTEARALGLADDAAALAKAHALHGLVRQDPFTQRAAAKPRGYAGDAVMMDYIYDAQAPAGTTALGQALLGCTSRSGMGLSVQYRRVLLRSLIDDVVATHGQGRVLSVAAGHCRELRGSLVQSPAFDGEFVALDQDAESCAQVAQDQAAHRVRVRHQGVRDLLALPADSSLGHFDLVYSAGLYDYLPDGLARRLTQRLLALLRPQGRLLVANFLPGGCGRGYQELFMDWTLILRDEAQMRQLALDAGARQLRSFVDPHRNVVYVELQA